MKAVTVPDNWTRILQQSISSAIVFETEGKSVLHSKPNTGLLHAKGEVHRFNNYDSR